MRKLVVFCGLIGIGLCVVIFSFFFKNRQSAVMEEKIFTESEEMVKNPYKGTYVQVTLGNPESLISKLEMYPDHEMVFLALDLHECINEDVEFSDKLKDLEYALNKLVEQKKSVIFRAAYDFEGDYIEPELELMLEHIPQIGKILNRYKDCLAGVQAGMIGPYGEWHSSDYMDSPEQYVRVVQAWLDILEDEIPVSLRRPKFIRQVEKMGVSIERLGFYNDGLFASHDDLGTYQEEDYDREAELLWSEEHLKVPFNGGEMPEVSEFAEIENVVKEAKQLHMSYMNRYHDKDVWEFWSTQAYDGMNGEEYLKKYLGIRPWLESVKYSKNFYKCKNITMDMELRNSGFSILDPNMKAYVFFKWQGEEEVLVKDEAVIDMRTKENSIISATVENPCWMKKPMEAKIGIMFTRGDDSIDGYWYRLANKDVACEDGIHWLVEYSSGNE